MSDASLALVETHISRLLFVGDRVLKWYRPEATPFLDHRSVAARRASCERELELNRRFAPDVYLDVVSVQGSDGRELEPAVLMRRLPADRRLAGLLDDPCAVDAVAAVARLVAAVHAGSGRRREVDAAGSPDAVAVAWLTNLRELAEVSVGVLDASEVAAAVGRFQSWVAGRRAFLESRVADGWIVDGHGDLLCDDIFVLDDGPRVLDCLAFRDDFRYGDVTADLAFLAMDLLRRGHPELLDVLVATYEEHRGHPVPRGLLWSWTAHRAFVRAKVACIRAAQGDGSATAEARELMAAGTAHQRRAEPLVVLVGGLPGTGKSTVAAALADELGASVLRTDEVRRDVPGPDGPGADDGPGSGRYGEAAVAATYRELVRRAGAILATGERAVLDATWSRAADRAAARAEAAARGAVVVEVRCDVDAEVAAARIRSRREVGGDPSEATEEVAAWMRSRTDPWPEAVVVDTAAAPEVVGRDAGAAVRDRLSA